MSWLSRQRRHESVVLKKCRYCKKGKLRTGQTCPACHGTGQAKTMVRRA